MTTFISKESISRLITDIKQIIKNPLSENGIYYVHDENDILTGYAMIVGPSETPYFGGYYFFKFKFPNNYPYAPPVVTYCTNRNNIRFNPNLYKCGKVCVSLLNTWSGEQWTSCQTISTILLTLCTLLCKDPLLNEPGVTQHHKDLEIYNKIIEYSNIEIAICDIINKHTGLHLDFFEHFTENIKENFLKNKDKLLNFIETKIQENKNNSPKVLSGGFYNMTVKLDYPKLKEQILQIQF
jgi:ubiquitin-protein ligase